MSITRAFEFPPLNGSVNPADGQLYLAGFQILGWGTTATRLAGLGRVRYTGAPSRFRARSCRWTKGVLLRFDVTLDAQKAADPDSYSCRAGTTCARTSTARRSSRRAARRATIALTPSAPTSRRMDAASSSACRSMKPVMQMRVGWSLATADGTTFQESASFTPYELRDVRSAGGRLRRTHRRSRAEDHVARASATVSADQGRRSYERSGCMACHAIDASALEAGPDFQGSLRPRTHVRRTDVVG